MTALLGHWFANSLFDRDQYAGVGNALLDRLDDPILVQAVFGLVAIVFLTITKRRREGRPIELVFGRGSVAVAVAIQLLLFVGMEGSERLAIDALAGARAHAGPFEIGFVAELLVAVATALMLAFFGQAAKRFLELHRPRRVPVYPAGSPLLHRGHAPATRTLAGAGGVRAPPR